ncbi:glycosyltransferase [Candidatus Sumerlaeota bacterium]|nr:glycosyltransferase [Candidatus Sumerlaeota bacterium]
MQSPHSWSGVWQRPHHLATQFAAAGHRIRWVEPRYLRWLLEDRRRFFGSRDQQPSSLIDVLSVTLINGERFGPVRRFNQGRLSRALRAGPSGAASDRRILWLYNPHEVHLAATVPHDLLVYDIMDEYRGFPWSAGRIAEEESELLGKADWVFAGTQALFDSKKDRAEGRIECHLSGVDTDHFRPPSGAREDSSAICPDDLQPLKGRYRRLLGYAGVIDLRLDQTLLADAARLHDDWGWILVGPVAADVANLRSVPNIHLLGQKSYKELPAYYHAWDCALIPFVESELTRHINPTKILEYAAAGLPVVTRALPDIERFYAEGAFLYRSAEEFESRLETVLGSDTASRESSDQVGRKLDRARQWARDRSWKSIAKKMLERVEKISKQ